MLKRLNLSAGHTVWFWIALWLLASCNPAPVIPTIYPSPSSPPASPVVETPTLAPTEVAATLTAVPLAASVNGLGITLDEYQVQWTLYQSVQAEAGTILATDAAKAVLDDLINETLLAQAAQEAGLVVDDMLLQTRLDRLAAQLGSQQALQDWMATYGFRPDVFRLTLSRSVAAAWMRDQLINAVPTAVEQIHARQILLYNSDEANTVLSQLKNGANFADLAFQFDPVAGGDLGWFPRGYLSEPTVEQAAFSLQPDQFSDVVQTRLGYHIIQVIERDPQRLLSPAARLILQETALRQWLTERYNQSTIQIYIP